MLKIGTDSFHYNQKRNFTGLPFDGVEFRKVYDLNKVRSYLKFRLTNKIDFKQLHRFNDFGLNRVDLYHFFNTITPIKRPWIVTFEHTLPRHDAGFRKGYEWLSGKYCKKIIAFSQRAFDLQMNELDRFPEFKEEIASKLCVVHPSQKMLVGDISSKDFSGELRLVFVGSAFFRKGGRELVCAFQRIKELGLRVRLTIVSKMEIEGYRDRNISKTIARETLEMIKKNSLIDYYDHLPNNEVLKLLKAGHVGILPSFGETYGYSLLEAMASGCAVVSTYLSPFNEFVNDAWGWLIEMPLVKSGNDEIINIDDPAEYKHLSQLLTERIVETICTIDADRKLLKEKAMNALDRIQTFHNPFSRISLIECFYREALI